MLKKSRRIVVCELALQPLVRRSGQAGQVALELQPLGWIIRPCAQTGRCSVKIEANE